MKNRVERFGIMIMFAIWYNHLPGNPRPTWEDILHTHFAYIAGLIVQAS